MQYEVQTRMGYDSWENCWTTEYPDGLSKPELYNTYAEASTALDEFLIDQIEAVANGNMLEEYDRQDYRIRPV